MALRFTNSQNQNRVTMGFLATRSPVFGRLLSKASFGKHSLGRNKLSGLRIDLSDADPFVPRLFLLLVPVAGGLIDIGDTVLLAFQIDQRHHCAPCSLVYYTYEQGDKSLSILKKTVLSTVYRIPWYNVPGMQAILLRIICWT